MISYIRGELVAIEEEKVIVDVGGVGYGILMPKQSMGLLPMPGAKVKLHTYLNVREDAMQLFGFLTRDDLEIFKLVIGVSGVGPKYGLNILSALSPDELRFAVLGNDVKAITKAQGIGKKMAEKLILELKDKFDMEEVISQRLDTTENRQAAMGNAQTEAVQALVALGYGSTEALRAVKSVAGECDDSVEGILKQALKHML